MKTRSAAYLALFILCFVSAAANAKGNREIAGYAYSGMCSVTPEGIAYCYSYGVENVTVQVFTKDLEPVTNVRISYRSGNFLVRGLKPGRYVLLVTSSSPPLEGYHYAAAMKTVDLRKKQQKPLGVYLPVEPD